MIQQVISRVCRRTNNYFVALLYASVSSILPQGYVPVQSNISFFIENAGMHFSCMKIDAAVVLMLIIVKLHKVFSLDKVLKGRISDCPTFLVWHFLQSGTLSFLL